jgi:hypothetical protein
MDGWMDPATGLEATDGKVTNKLKATDWTLAD